MPEPLVPFLVLHRILLNQKPFSSPSQLCICTPLGNLDFSFSSTVSSAGRNQSAEVLSPESDALLQPPTLNLASDGNDETDEKAATSAGHADVHVSIPAEHRGNGLPRLFEVANSTDVAGGAEIYEDSANSGENCD